MKYTSYLSLLLFFLCTITFVYSGGQGCSDEEKEMFFGRFCALYDTVLESFNRAYEHGVPTSQLQPLIDIFNDVKNVMQKPFALLTCITIKNQFKNLVDLLFEINELTQRNDNANHA